MKNVSVRWKMIILALITLIGTLAIGVLAVNRMLVKKENLFAKEPISEKNDVVVEQNDLKTEKAVTTETSAKKQSGKKQSRKQRKLNKS